MFNYFYVMLESVDATLSDCCYDVNNSMQFHQFRIQVLRRNISCSLNGVTLANNVRRFISRKDLESVRWIAHSALHISSFFLIPFFTYCVCTAFKYCLRIFFLQAKLLKILYFYCQFFNLIFYLDKTL
jgi:hypothetical protein